MKTENEIKTKVLNEVIEKLDCLLIENNGQVDKYSYFNEGIESAIHVVQSLLPKEEPEPTQEIKAVERVEYAFKNEDYRNHIVTFHCQTKSGKFICEDEDGIVFVADKIRKVQPTKTQEEMDSEKAEAIMFEEGWIKKNVDTDSIKRMLLQMADYGRNTKQL
jgi:hypothetical protein